MHKFESTTNVIIQDAESVIDNKKSKELEYNQTYSVYIPNPEEQIAIKKSTLKKIKTECKRAKNNKFPWSEIFLSISSLCLGAFLGAITSKITYGLNLLSVLYYNIAPTIGIGFLVAYFFYRKRENENIINLATKIEEYLSEIDDNINGFLELHTSIENKPTDKTVNIKFDKTILTDNKLGNLDLVAIPLAGILNELSEKGIHVFYRTVDPNIVPSEKQINELSAMEDITFIGYPSGLYDTINKIPILRQGITATPIWNDFQGKENFLIDAGVFPGSSGSPVFIYNHGSYPTKDGIAIGSRLLFVGVISKTLQIKDAMNNYLNLGMVINSKSIFRELDKFIQRKKQDNNTKAN